jgi:hypothetical protein
VGSGPGPGPGHYYTIILVPVTPSPLSTSLPPSNPPRQVGRLAPEHDVSLFIRVASISCSSLLRRLRWETKRSLSTPHPSLPSPPVCAASVSISDLIWSLLSVLVLRDCAAGEGLGRLSGMIVRCCLCFQVLQTQMDGVVSTF